MPTTKLPEKEKIILGEVPLDPTITHDFVLNERLEPEPEPTEHAVSALVSGAMTPEKVTSVPGPPDDGLSVMELVVVEKTVIVDEAASPVKPVAVIV